MKQIYLDNAATTYPKPRAVINAVTNSITSVGANPGRGSYYSAEQAGELIFRAREHICSFLGLRDAVSKLTLPQRVIFTPGCTWSINCVLKGILHCGDNVVISDMEHNAVVRPLEQLQKQGVSVTRAHVVEGDRDATVANFRAAIGRNTKMIFCTHASNVFGLQLPARELCRLAHTHGLLFGMDCAQSAGTAELNFDTIDADFLCMPTHKGLYGIMGCGLLLIGGETIPDTLCEGGTGSLSALREMPSDLPDRLEPGTPNLPAIAAVNAGIETIEHYGRENILHHELYLMQELHRELSRMEGVELYTRCPELGCHTPLLSFNIGDKRSDEAAEFLSAQGIAVRAGYHCAYDAHLSCGTSQRGTIRVSPSIYTTENDIEYLLRAIRSQCRN